MLIHNIAQYMIIYGYLHPTCCYPQLALVSTQLGFTPPKFLLLGLKCLKSSSIPLSRHVPKSTSFEALHVRRSKAKKIGHEWWGED